MGRVRIRDQYSIEHWVDEGQLVYEPWRSCEVLGREGDEPAESTPVDSGDPKPSKKAAPRPASDVKEQVVE